jgi:iron complex outermembrane receptor protein
MRYFYPKITQGIKAQTSLGITQELSYTKEKQHVRFMLHMMEDEDSLLQNTMGNPNDTKYFSAIINYDYDFDKDNKMNLQLYYAGYEDIFNLDELNDISGYISFFNTYEDFDFYNGIVWHRNSIDWTNYFDWTASVTWNISEEMTLTLKGDNILNKAKETNLYRFDVSTLVPIPLDSLAIPHVDRRFTIELEYLF